MSRRGTTSIARRIPARLRPRSRGQALVEFAVILPVLMLILLGSIDFGRIMFSYIQINNAAREGVAYAMGQPNDVAGITQRALQETDVQSQRGENPVTVTVTCIDSATGTVVTCSSAPSTGLGSEVKVAVSEQFNFFTPLISNLFPEFTMTASSTGFTLSPVTTSTTTTTSTTSTSTTTTTTTSTSTTTTTTSTATALCTVPTFVGQKGKAASSMWTGAGFASANLTNNVPGNSGINQQSLGAGTSQPCTTATITLN
ncbi:MAG: pilus assembly protein [Propionibacterium sp.]|nr:pilus assembly protein [Propionibacterium sp.]